MQKGTEDIEFKTLDSFLSAENNLDEKRSLWLNFHYCTLSPLNGQKLVISLLEKKLPQSLTLSLFKNDLGPIGAEAFAEFIQSNKAPPQLIIDMSKNNIGFEGAKALASALKNACLNLKLKLTQNKLGDKGAQIFAQHLKNSRPHLTLDLSNNQITNIGAIALFDALTEAKPGLTLDLSANPLNDSALKHLANLIKAGKLPYKLSLRLNACDLTTQGAKILLTALKQGLPPDDFHLAFAYTDIDSEIEKEISKALLLNTIRYAQLYCVTFLLGKLDSSNPISHLSTDMFSEIFNLLFPLKAPANQFPKFHENIYRLFNQLSCAQKTNKRKNEIDKQIETKKLKTNPFCHIL